ncbi:MAG: hypothetical protein AAF479_14725 [Pseudomonadota bacterium]
MEDEDPVVDYKIDFLADPMTDTTDRELVLSYVRAARRYRELDARSFLLEFPEVTRALEALGQDRRAGLQRLLGLHHRHGAGISQVVDNMLAGHLKPGNDVANEDDTFLSLVGQERFSVRQPFLRSQLDAIRTPEKGSDSFILKLTDAQHSRSVEIEGLGTFTGAKAEVLYTFAEQLLAARGLGLAPEDHPFTLGRKLAEAWGLESDVGVRKRIQSLRTLVSKRANASGQLPPDRNAIIENLPWRGYRLNPTGVDVIRSQD